MKQRTSNTVEKSVHRRLIEVKCWSSIQGNLSFQRDISQCNRLSYLFKQRAVSLQRPISPFFNLILRGLSGFCRRGGDQEVSRNSVISLVSPSTFFATRNGDHLDVFGIGERNMHLGGTWSRVDPSRSPQYMQSLTLFSIGRWLTPHRLSFTQKADVNSKFRFG